MGNTCGIKEQKNIKSPSSIDIKSPSRIDIKFPSSIDIKFPSSIDIKFPSSIDIYMRIVPRIAYYLKKKNIRGIFKYKCPLFAAGGWDRRIYLFSNSLEHIGTFVEHKGSIYSLCGISNKILASGSMDKKIKIWDIEERAIISTLSGHTDGVTTLCYVEEGQLVSGSKDKSLIIWSKLPGSSSTYSHRQVLTGHESGISGIIRINKTVIMSGEYMGDVRIWNIDQGICIRHIYSMDHGGLSQMKQHHEGEVALSYTIKVLVLGAVNNWETPIKQFRVSDGYSIEFLDRDILLIGGLNGELEFIDYSQTGCYMPPDIQQLHSSSIQAIQRIAKNIIVTASYDGYTAVMLTWFWAPEGGDPGPLVQGSLSWTLESYCTLYSLFGISEYSAVVLLLLIF